MATVRRTYERIKFEKPVDEHFELCLLAERFLRSQNFGVVFRDGFKAVTSSGEQPDALGLRSGTSCLIEVKVSRADFLSDRNKKFRKNPELGVGNWRFYLAPPGIIEKVDLPEGWGLLSAENGKVKKIFGWPPNTKWPEGPFRAKTNTQAEREIMYSALRRMEIKGHLKSIYSGIYGRCSLCDSLLPERFENHPEHGKICLHKCSWQ